MALVEIVGVHFTYVSTVERGERNVSLHTIVRLAEGLRMDPRMLVKSLTV
jgi:transcriptional regulator with XRE-family HTH domain